MSRRAVTALCLVAVLVCCAAGSSRRFRTFRSPTYDYSVEVKADWSTLTADHELADGEPPLTGAHATDVLAKHADNLKVSEMTFPVVVIGAQPVPGDETIDAWTAAVVENVSVQKGCDAPERTEAIEVSGADGVVLTYPDCPAGTGYLHLWVAVVEGGRGFHIVFFDDAGHGRADRKELHRLLATFSFG